MRCLEAPLAHADDLTRVHRSAYVDLIFKHAEKLPEDAAIMREPHRPQISSPDSKPLPARAGPVEAALFERSWAWLRWNCSQLM